MLRRGSTQSCGCLHKEIIREQQMIDLIGNRYGRLEVIGYDGFDRCKKYGTSTQRNHKWRCKCDCGNDVVVLGGSLRSGTTQSCGCLHKERTSKARFIDMTGQKFGQLLVVNFAGRRGNEYLWLCKCDCGREKAVNGCSLRRGLSKSCGCYNARRTHGMWGKPGYKAIYLKDPVKKIRHGVSRSVALALKKRNLSKGGGKTFDHLPYTPLELKEHLEKRFEPWMTWDNYGGANDNPERTWHIDHIRPQAVFPYASLDDPLFQECWALKNLRPLEKIANMTKGAR